jgi:hypothetical protein
MVQIKTIGEWMAERAIDLAQLTATSGLSAKVVEAIVANRYTPSPQQRERLAAAVGVSPEHVVWGHAASVEHVYGHGPQFGRSP